MKKEKTPKIVSLAILTLITSVLWIFFAVYRSITKKEEPKAVTDVIIPLTPTLDSKTITQIETRVYVEEGQIPQTVIPSNQKTPTPTLKPEEETQTATNEATIQTENENAEQ